MSIWVCIWEVYRWIHLCCASAVFTVQVEAGLERRLTGNWLKFGQGENCCHFSHWVVLRFQNHQHKASGIHQPEELGRSHLAHLVATLNILLSANMTLWIPGTWLLLVTLSSLECFSGQELSVAIDSHPEDNWKSILEYCHEAGLSPKDLPPAGEFVSFYLWAKHLCLIFFIQASMSFFFFFSIKLSPAQNELKFLKI